MTYAGKPAGLGLADFRPEMTRYSRARRESAACPAANIHDFNHEKARPS
jgi:hypothetical protein